MRACIYARVSKEEEVDSDRYQNPDNQLQPLREFCKAMQYDLIREYVDFASGGNSNRPQFQQMLTDARQHRFDLIVIWALDRFSRESLSNTLKYIQDLKRHRIGLKSYTESWLDTSQEGVAELLLAIFSWVAAEERKKISRRTKAGIQRLKNIGAYSGGRPRKTPPSVSRENKPKQEQTSV